MEEIFIRTVLAKDKGATIVSSGCIANLSRILIPIQGCYLDQNETRDLSQHVPAPTILLPFQLRGCVLNYFHAHVRLISRPSRHSSDPFFLERGALSPLIPYVACPLPTLVPRSSQAHSGTPPSALYSFLSIVSIPFYHRHWGSCSLTIDIPGHRVWRCISAEAATLGGFTRSSRLRGRTFSAIGGLDTLSPHRALPNAFRTACPGFRTAITLIPSGPRAPTSVQFRSPLRLLIVSFFSAGSALLDNHLASAYL